MSSPMMTRMFGLGCCAEAGAAAIVIAAIVASRTDHPVILMGFPPVRRTRGSGAAAGTDRRRPVLKLATNSLARSVPALLSLGAVLPAMVLPPHPTTQRALTLLRHIERLLGRPSNSVPSPKGEGADPGLEPGEAGGG